MPRLTIHDVIRQPEYLAAAAGLAFCLAIRDMPQFFAFEAINSIAATQYMLAAGRGIVFAAVLLLLHSQHIDIFAESTSPARFLPVSLAALCACIGLGIVSFTQRGNWQVVGSFVLGFGQSAFLFSWTLYLLRKPRRIIFYLLICSLVAAGAIEMLMAFVVPIAARVVTLVFPVVSLALLVWLTGEDTTKADMEEGPGRHRVEAQADKQDQPFRLDRKTMVVLLTFWGYSFVARQLTDTWMANGTVGNLFVFQMFAGAGTALAATLVLLIFRLRKQYKTPAIYSAFVLPLLLLALFLSTFLAGFASILYVTPLFVLRKMIFFMAIAEAFSLPPGLGRMRLFSWCFLFVEIGNICQTWFFELIKTLPSSGDIVSYAVVSVIILLIILSELSLFFTGKSLQPVSEPLVERPESAAELAEKRRETAIARMQSEFGLTKRETEVLALLATGRNADYIAKTLFIAHSTAKSHIAHIYQKTGINSQQRLMDMIESSDSDNPGHYS